jgi:gamma-butyrobetaine dioxygenase
VHPTTRQKLHSSGSISPDIRPLSSAITIDHSDTPLLEVQWPGNHKSEFQTEWLQRNDYSAEAVSRRRRRDLEPIVWTASALENENIFVSHSNLMDDSNQSESLFRALDILRKYGLLFVKDVPLNDREVEAIATRFGPIRETLYGRSWDVKSVANAKNIAYTSLFLGLHMDLMYAYTVKLNMKVFRIAAWLAVPALP